MGDQTVQDPVRGRAWMRGVLEPRDRQSVEPEGLGAQRGTKWETRESWGLERG